ncbi:hypothetical protein D3C80_1402940 [compost metagenome]
MIISVASPLVLMVLPGTVMLEVGLSAMLTTMSWPEEMPPRMPPAWLLAKPAGVISSRCSEPFCSTTAKPSPISTPFTALMPIMAWAMSASSRSNTGSPSPTGTLRAMTATLAPMLLPSFLRARMYSSRASSLPASGKKKGFCSIWLASKASALMGPSWERKPTISMPCICLRYFLAMAPAATRMAVSRAEERPPPR